MASTGDNEEEYYSSPEEAEGAADDDDRMSFRTASNESDNDAGADDDADADDCLYGNSDGDDDGMYDEYDGDEEEGLEEVDEEGGILDEMRFTATQYAVLTMDEVRARQEEHTARVADLIALPPALAAAVLRHFKWSAQGVWERWFSDEHKVRDAVGLPAYGDAVSVAVNDAPLTCYICFDAHAPGEMRSAGCAHFYCRGCWSGYVRAAVGDGARCLSIRCPDMACSAAVVRDLVDEVADADDAKRYGEFLVRSYVEESKRIRWCPAPGCDRAVEFDGEKCTVQLDAWCACGHGFCLACGEEAHRPVACDTVREWLEKNRSDSETAQWVLANTKHCPECRRPIEKNQGCMHMTCSPPCKHQFCWLCLGPWGKHDGGNYNCNTYNAARAEGKYTKEELRRAQAKASVDRYLHYYERWGAHERSRQKALEDTAALGKDGAQRRAVAAAFGVVETELDFLEEAYRQVAECRRMLRWTYAFGYYLDDPAKRDLFEDLQSQADKSLERLHECAEKDRVKLVAEAAGEHGAVADKYLEFRPKLSSLTTVARNHFENMARAFRDGLAEVEVDPAVAARRAAAAPPPPPLDDVDDEDFFEELRM
ncbi:probable E3 ubiquitin-protein ligase ARI5 [Triticum dicoccoides]|uniref:probable E3 ubiquitin-protein ligase ARI5 n=1 Tax=Triticum dicoccoides TaxID=85692 RepID=UPI00188E3E34|nr:probable E3 ubiquitin-protein ligase ARI5 [Triticum dicoccoides]